MTSERAIWLAGPPLVRQVVRNFGKLATRQLRNIRDFVAMGRNLNFNFQFGIQSALVYATLMRPSRSPYLEIML